MNFEMRMHLNKTFMIHQANIYKPVLRVGTGWCRGGGGGGEGRGGREPIGDGRGEGEDDYRRPYHGMTTKLVLYSLLFFLLLYSFSLFPIPY